MDPARYPIAVPHVSWSQGVLYFGERPLRESSEAEWALLSRCDGSRSLGELAVEPADARVIAALLPWLIWWDTPLPPAPVPTCGASRLVLAPGPASAWLAMGGRLLMEAETRPTAVITCFGLTAKTVEPLAFGTPDDLATIVRDELALVARLSGVHHELWEFPASELRQPDRHQSALASVEWLKSMLREVIGECLARTAPAEIFVPVSTEPQSDAGVVLDVVLGMHVDGLLHDAQLHVFESSTVVSGARAIDEFLGRFEGSYVELPDYFVPISARIVHKASVLEVFRSCVDRATRAEWLESASWNHALGGGEASLATDPPRDGHAERFWAARLADA